MSFDLSKAISLLLFVLIFASVVAIGKAFGLKLNNESNFSALTVLLSASLAAVLTLAGRRILLGPQPTRSLSFWLKVILFFAVPLILVLAIWDGIDARQREEAENRPRTAPID